MVGETGLNFISDKPKSVILDNSLNDKRFRLDLRVDKPGSAGILPACGRAARSEGPERPGPDEGCGRDGSGGRCGQDARAPRS